MNEKRRDQTGWVDTLDQKLFNAFPGRVVRKDLVKRFKVGDNIPVYVLEYLLGKYCSTTNAGEIEEGILRVKDIIAERIVRADRGELIKSNLRKNGVHKLIDLVTVIFDEKDEGGKYWAHLAAAGLDHVHIKENLVYEHERLLTGGIWANLEITYDETLMHKGATRPFVLNRLQPIQIASANLQEFLEGRARFTRDEWIDVLLRTMGYEPTNNDFTPRRKLLFLTRMIPMVEKNYNLIELGPRGTGKSYVYREISPYVILLSGGQGSVADLFGWKNRNDKPGLVVRYDLVAFDEVAGPNFKKENDKADVQGVHGASGLSPVATTREPSRPMRGSFSTATSTATSNPSPGCPTFFQHCLIPSATTWPSTIAGTATCRAGKSPRCRRPILRTISASSPITSPRSFTKACATRTSQMPTNASFPLVTIWRPATGRQS